MVSGSNPVGTVPTTAVGGSDLPKTVPPVAPPEAPAAIASDSLKASAPTSATAVPTVSLFTDAKGPTPHVGGIKTDSPPAANPWHLKSMNVRYGLMYHVGYANSDIRLQNASRGTDVTLHNVAAHNRLSASYLYSMPNGFPQPDEPQYEAGISGKFENNWGFEVNIKHNKYVVMTGEDPDQQVHMTGTIEGRPVDEVRSLKGYLPEYQITDGLNQFSFMATRSFNLPHPKKDSFTYNVKAGPSVLMPFVKSTIINGDGTESHQEGPYKFGAGFGGQIEQSLRYDFRNQVSLEVTHGISGMSVTNGSSPDGGKSSQVVWAQQFGVTLGKTFNFHKKH